MALYRGLAGELKIHEVVNYCCAFAICTSAVRLFFLTPPPQKNSIAFFKFALGVTVIPREMKTLCSCKIFRGKKCAFWELVGKRRIVGSWFKIGNA